MILWHRDARTISSALKKSSLVCLSSRPIPGYETRGNRTPDAPSPQFAGIGKNTPPPRATPSPLQDTPFQPDHDAVPHIVIEVQGRDYALQEPTDDHIVLAAQRALTYARHLFRRGNCNNSILYYSEHRSTANCADSHSHTF